MQLVPRIVAATTVSRVVLALLATIGVAALYAGIMLTCGSGARARAPTHAGCIDIVAHGADGSGVHDSSAAFRSAVAASDPDAVCIYFPTGSYRFSASPTITLRTGTGHEEAAITIMGDGSALSRLRFDADVSGPVLRLNGPRQSFHIRDISILAGGRSTVADGLSVIQEGAPNPNPSQSDISGVSIYGQDGINKSDRFARGLYFHQVSNVTITNTAITGSSDGAPYAKDGTCLYVDGTRDSIPVGINIIGSQINYCRYGLYYGAYLQGVQILGSNLVGNDIAIYQPVGKGGNDQLSVTGSQFNSGTRNVLLLAPIDGVTITGNDFYLSPAGAASIDMPGVQFTIQANTFIQLGRSPAPAITIGPFMLAAGVITGNSFSNSDRAIVLQPGSSRVNVQSNAYSDIRSDKVVDHGTLNTVGGGSI